MVDIPEEAVKAAKDLLYYANPNDVERALTAALPFLSVQGAVKKLEWELVSGDHYAEGSGTHYNIYETRPDFWNCVTVKPVNVRLATNVSLEAAKAAAQADFEARILSALEPSAGRAAVLEEIIALCKDYAEDSQPDSEYRLACNDIIEALQERRALHPVADKSDEAGAQVEEIERAEFHRGYVLACANIVNLHGADVAVMEGFAQLGISKAELQALDLCEYDQKAIDTLEDFFGADKLYLTSAPASEGAE